MTTMRRKPLVPLALALLLAASLALPAASAQAEPRGYHIYGNVALNGEMKDGAVLRIQGQGGDVDLQTAYAPGNPTDTPYGNMLLSDRYGPDGPTPMEGWLHFFVEVPAGTYMLDITSGGKTFMRVVEATGTAHETYAFPHGTYYLIDLGDVTLEVPGAARPTPDPEPMPDPAPTPAPTGTAGVPTPGPGAPTAPAPTVDDLPPATSPAATGASPTPTVTGEADPASETPGPGLALLLAGLAAAAVELRRRA